MKTRGNYVYFFTEKDCFSNWYMADFVVKGIKFSCMEQYMMFAKAMLFGDKEIAARVMEAKTPKEHKALGKLVSNFSEPVWIQQRRPIVTAGAIHKFRQNHDILRVLLSTDDKILVEASPFDKIWGVKLSMDDPRIYDEKNWKGLNLLGYSLMDSRSVLSREFTLEQLNAPARKESSSQQSFSM